MRDAKEAALLRAIAENYEDDSGRLVLSDLLEERGDSARAELLRVQCELAAPKLAKKRRQELRERERALLDEHWQEWVEAFGLPIEDVGFNRGLIARMRLSKGNRRKLLDPAYAPWLVTLRELDLSGLGIDDAYLTAFAEKAVFPALRQLYLNGNKLTSEGIRALTEAKGLPQLDTVYLFDNDLDAPTLVLLKKAKHFSLSKVDLGEHDEGYSLSPGQADMARRQYIREDLLPAIKKTFKKYPHLRSALLCVAQYWADEADDAVHGRLIVSELLEPDLKRAQWGDPEDPQLDPNVPNTLIKGKYRKGGSVLSLWDLDAPWDDNRGAIPLWAAYAPEEGSQEFDSVSDVYAPAVMFFRYGGYEFLPMSRPHLVGIRPEWDNEA